ncbi:MAG TPA: hypothetical protein VNH18_16490, partial [Bryobacteraceae bacterium]|nr:hypothetical protein [Bryobacteraceae bacterium]
RFPTAPIYEMLITMYEAGEPVSYESLNARLSEAQQDLLSSIVLAQELPHQPTAEDALSCLAAIQRSENELAGRELRDKIKTAEREGRFQDAFELMRQLPAPPRS